MKSFSMFHIKTRYRLSIATTFSSLSLGWVGSRRHGYDCTFVRPAAEEGPFQSVHLLWSGRVFGGEKHHQQHLVGGLDLFFENFAIFVGNNNSNWLFGMGWDHQPDILNISQYQFLVNVLDKERSQHIELVLCAAVPPQPSGAFL